MNISLILRNEIHDHQGGIKQLGIQSSGRIFFARSDQMLVLYKLPNGEKIHGFYDSAGYDAARFDGDSRMLISQSNEYLNYWDTETFRQIATIPGELFEYRDTDVHPGEKLLADGGHDGRIHVKQLSSDMDIEPDYILEGHTKYIEYVCFHPGGKILASGSADMTLRFWDLSARSEISSHKVHNDFISALAFSPDGSTLVSGDYSGTLKIWDFRLLG